MKAMGQKVEMPRWASIAILAKETVQHPLRTTVRMQAAAPGGNRAGATTEERRTVREACIEARASLCALRGGG